MSFSTVQLTHQYKNLDGTPASGTVELSLSGAMHNGTVSYAASAPITAALDSGGNLSVSVPATNDPGTVPQGRTYQVTEKVTGARAETWTIQVPAGTSPLDITSLYPVDEVAT